MAIPVIRLTGRAARFLRLLHDFGHLDDEALAQVELGALEAPGSLGGTADLADVRRAAARLLFERNQGRVDGLLAEDWPLLFS